MTFKTAVWVDPETEHYCARIFPETEGIDLAAWGLTADEVQPIDLSHSRLHGPDSLGPMIEEAMFRIAPDYPREKNLLVFIGYQQRGADVRAALNSKLAEVAA